MKTIPPISTVVVQDTPPSSNVATPPPSPAECLQRAQSARSKGSIATQTVVQQSSDRPRSSPSGSAVSNKRALTKSSLPLTKSVDGRRPGSSRGSGRTRQRSPGLAVEGGQRQQYRTAGTDDNIAVSSSSDGFSDDTASSANDHASTSPPPG